MENGKFRLASYLMAAICIAALAPSVQAQSVRTRIPVVTRLVKIYSDYEERLAEAINHRDAAGIDQLVAKDFELWPANHIGVPTPRAEWVAQSFKEPLASISTMMEETIPRARSSFSPARLTPTSSSILMPPAA